MKMYPQFPEVPEDNEEPQAQAPLVQLGNLPPLFLDDEAEDEGDAEDEDPDPIVRLGDLSPLFLNE